MSNDVIIVGGGVIGCSIAWRLSQAGLKVALYERGRAGCEASRAAAGMLTPQGEAAGPSPFLDLCLRSRAMYRNFAQELGEASGVDIEYREEGTLFVALSEEDDARTRNWAKWQSEAGLALEQIPREDLRLLEPEVTEAATGGVFLPDEHQVENRRLMDALEAVIKRAGVTLLEGSEVTGLAVEGERVTGVQVGGTTAAAGAVILAAGSWSGRLLEAVGLKVAIIPARGQMLAVRSAKPRQPARVLHSNRVYLVPRRDGRILIGATVEYAGFDKAVTVNGIDYLLGAALELMPSLRDLEIVEWWSGLRPDTIDHLPVLGPSGIDNLWLATGHFRNGILLAPITAELIAQSVIGSRQLDSLEPFGVSRLGHLSGSRLSIDANRAAN